MSREDAIAAAEAQAIERAVAAGADRGSLQTVDVEDMPLAYLPGNALARPRARRRRDATAGIKQVTGEEYGIG